MTIYYLYVKTHNKTGLKYLGYTTKRDPFKYKGSGKDWLPHLKEHGCDIRTDIIKVCNTHQELSYWGRYYSNLWNVVYGQDDYGNKIWANRIPETGNGIVNAGGDFNKGENNPMYGRKRTDLSGPDSPNKSLERRKENSTKSRLMWQDPEFKNKQKQRRKELWKDPSYVEKMKNRTNSTKAVSIHGIWYSSMTVAARDLRLDPSTVSKRCASTHDRFKDWTYA